MTESVRLAELTPDNVATACGIRVKPEQERFVAPVSRTGADLRSALEGVPPPDDRFGEDIAGALALISGEGNDPWAGACTGSLPVAAPSC
jgi:diamine N-acetyltransferase